MNHIWRHEKYALSVYYSHQPRSLQNAAKQFSLELINISGGYTKQSQRGLSKALCCVARRIIFISSLAVFTPIRKQSLQYTNSNTLIFTLSTQNGVACVRKLLGGYRCIGADRAVPDLLVRASTFDYWTKQGVREVKTKEPFFGAVRKSLFLEEPVDVALPQQKNLRAKSMEVFLTWEVRR